MMEQRVEIGEGRICRSSSSCKKQTVGVHEKEDRLSSLPEHILAHILSFLPTKDAVKTVALRTFGNLWTSLHNLDFDVFFPKKSYADQGHLRFLNFVDHVLILHQSPTILQFSLTLRQCFGCAHRGSSCIDPSPYFRIPHKVDSWISFAVSKKVKILKVDILERDSMNPLFKYDLPDFMFENDFLTGLELGNCFIKPQGQIHWRSLMALSLTAIMLSQSLMEEILSGCPMLESLSLIRCYGLKCLHITSTHLQNLAICFGFREESRLEICCPCVKALNLSGPIWLADIKIISSLINAHIDFCCGGRSSNVHYQNVGMVLEQLKHAKFFAVCNWSVLVLSLPLNIASPSLSRKGIVLTMMLTKYHFHGIVSLLLNSPCLESVTINIEPGTSLLTSDDVMWLKALGIHGDNCWTNAMWLKRSNFDADDYWASQQPFDCLTNHLKTIEIYGWIANPLVISLVKYLLRFSNVLEKVSISTKGNSQSCQSNCISSKQLQELSKNLLNSPKASDGGVILFS